MKPLMLFHICLYIVILLILIVYLILLLMPKVIISKGVHLGIVIGLLLLSSSQLGLEFLLLKKS